MSEIRNYGTSSSNQDQRDGEYRRTRERNWRPDLCYYPVVGCGFFWLMFCLMAVLGLFRDQMPLVVLIIGFSVASAGMAISCYCTYSYVIHWRRATRRGSLEEQAPRNPGNRIQNPDSPCETEALFRGNTESRVQNPGSLSQSEGIVTSSPQIGVQNPGPSYQTQRLDTLV